MRDHAEAAISVTSFSLLPNMSSLVPSPVYTTDRSCNFGQLHPVALIEEGEWAYQAERQLNDAVCPARLVRMCWPLPSDHLEDVLRDNHGLTHRHARIGVWCSALGHVAAGIHVGDFIVSDLQRILYANMAGRADGVWRQHSSQVGSGLLPGAVDLRVSRILARGSSPAKVTKGYLQRNRRESFARTAG